MNQKNSASEYIHLLQIPTLERQVKIWQFWSNSLKFPSMVGLKEVSTRGEGLVLVPKLSFWKKRMKAYAATAISSRLGNFEGILEHFEFPGKERVVDTYCESPAINLRLRRATEGFLNDLEQLDYSDFCLFHFSASLRYAGLSPDELIERISPDEVALDPFTVFSILYLCKIQERDARVAHFIQCPGAQYDYGGKGKWTDSPRWDDACGRLSLDWNWSNRARKLYVNAVGSKIVRVLKLSPRTAHTRFFFVCKQKTRL